MGWYDYRMITSTKGMIMTNYDATLELSTLNDLLNATHDIARAPHTDHCSDICDMIIELASTIDSLNIAPAIMRAALMHDPTESDCAAHIRDTLRDNCDTFNN